MSSCHRSFPIPPWPRPQSQPGYHGWVISPDVRSSSRSVNAWRRLLIDGELWPTKVADYTCIFLQTAVFKCPFSVFNCATRRPENKRPEPAVSTKHLYSICTMLAQRRRRWADVVQMLCKCFVFAEEPVDDKQPGSARSPNPGSTLRLRPKWWPHVEPMLGHYLWLDDIKSAALHISMVGLSWDQTTFK